MKFIRIALHGLMLTVINFGSIIIGYMAYQYLFRHHHPFQVQVPVALIITSISFLLWKMLARVSGIPSIMLHGLPEYFFVYCVSLLWTPIVFIPVHSMITGTVTAPGNILGIWIFQLWANAIALAIVSWLARWVKYAVEIAS